MRKRDVDIGGEEWGEVEREGGVGEGGRERRGNFRSMASTSGLEEM